MCTLRTRSRSIRFQTQLQLKSGSRYLRFMQTMGPSILSSDSSSRPGSIHMGFIARTVSEKSIVLTTGISYQNETPCLS